MTMAECTESERALLDAMKGPDGLSIAEARAKVAIESVPRELFESAVAARSLQIRASQMYEKAWQHLGELGVPSKWTAQTKAFDVFYESIETAAAERAGQ